MVLFHSIMDLWDYLKITKQNTLCTESPIPARCVNLFKKSNGYKSFQTVLFNKMKLAPPQNVYQSV